MHRIRSIEKNFAFATANQFESMNEDDLLVNLMSAPGAACLVTWGSNVSLFSPSSAPF